MNDEHTVSPGALRVARRFLIRFFDNANFPEDPDGFVLEAVNAFQALAHHLECHLDKAPKQAVPIIVHALERIRTCLSLKSHQGDFVRFIHQNAEDLGVLRADLVKFQIFPPSDDKT